MTDRPAGSLALDDQLCFALYAASRAMTARYRPFLDRIGLTYPQYLVLLVLWEEGVCTVSHLGARLRLDSGTVSPLLKRLETRGLISRSRRSDDERSVDVALTDSGTALRARVVDLPDRMSGLIGDLDPEQLRQELRALEDLLHRS